ncbi:MAG TPA: diacylglycerol kinase family protein [Longimicrobiales bacterium]|nr:diacylglycerol kinase family protein [Longimicrobiales bacterium]
MNKRIALVVRPPTEETRLAELRAGAESLRRSGHDVAIHMTGKAGDARRMARDAALEGCEVVVAAGGDGTVNEVVNGLARAGRECALAVVPLGTANDFARGLGIPPDIASALRVAADGTAVPADVARVNRRCFINVSTGGFGADATQEASRSVKRRLGQLAYVIRGARKILDFRNARGLFRADGRVVHDGEFAFFAVGNSSMTGGGTMVAPRAEVADGQLDITIVKGLSRLDFMALLPDLRAGSHMESPDVLYLRAHRLEVETAGDVAVNADGEAVAGTTYRYDLLGRPLLVMRPGR